MLNSICDALIQLVILIPFVLVAKRDNKSSKTKFLVIAALIFIVTSVVAYMFSNVSLFQGQKWNWTGKSISLLIAFLFIFTFKSFTVRQFGLTTKIELTNAKPILTICFIYLLIRVAIYLAVATDADSVHTETLLYQAILPGLQEEIIFRGILLTLLNHVLVKPTWMFSKVHFGWATVITSILFGLTHGIHFGNNYNIQLNIFAFLRTAFDGFLFALLVERTKSLIPSIVFHNLLNLIGNH